jgi:hypothetical protein
MAKIKPEVVDSVLAQEKLNEYLNKCVQIDGTAINDEFIQFPADIAYWAAQHSNAVKAFLRADQEHDKVRAKRWLIIREELLAKGDKATEKTVEASVECDAEYQEVRYRYVEAEAEKVRLAGIMEAMKSKKEMLISLGANLRVEMGSDPMIRSQQRESKVR